MNPGGPAVTLLPIVTGKGSTRPPKPGSRTERLLRYEIWKLDHPEARDDAA